MHNMKKLSNYLVYAACIVAIAFSAGAFMKVSANQVPLVSSSSSVAPGQPVDLTFAAEKALPSVVTVRVVTNHFNGKSKGFAFVVMPNRPEAEAAIAALDNKEVLGRPMRVNEAKNTLKESV